MSSDPVRLLGRSDSRLIGSPLFRLACGALVASTFGCQHADGIGRIAVSGTVRSASGEPITGTISFLPKNGTEGPAATASLIDGVFAFHRDNGPVEGEYRVLVVRSTAEQKHKGSSSPAGADSAPAAAAPRDDDLPSDQEWSFDADVSAENFEFEFEVPD